MMEFLFLQADLLYAEFGDGKGWSLTLPTITKGLRRHLLKRS